MRARARRWDVVSYPAPSVDVFRMVQQSEKQQSHPVFTLAPSDLTFLLHECLRCFYKKVVLGERRYSTPMPAIFTRLDKQQRAFLDGKKTNAVHAELRPGVLHCEDRSLRSQPIPLPSGRAAVQFRGAIDAAAEFDDGSWGIIDFKTTGAKDAHVRLYSLQLHAYALAAENPEHGEPTMAPVTQLGLVCFEPRSMMLLPDKDVAYRATPTWVPVKRDDSAFLSFIDLIAFTLCLPKPPAPTPGCRWCKFMSRFGAEPVPSEHTSSERPTARPPPRRTIWVTRRPS